MPTRQGSFDLDRQIRRIAARQLGLITFHQAARSGIDGPALARRRTAGALHFVFPNVLRLTTVAEHREQRVLAAALAVPGSTIAATSAALIHGFPVPPAAGLSRCVLSVAAQRPVRIEGIRAIRFGVAPPSQRWMTVRVATPEAALVTLPRVLPPALVERCLDHCLTHRLVTVDSVALTISRLPPSAVKGRQLLATLLDERSEGTGHRSRLEQRIGSWLRSAGLVDWSRNFLVAVSRGRPIEVDFAFPAVRVALEVSPFSTHGSKSSQSRDAERRRLLVTAGWRVVEATDTDLESPTAFQPTIAAIRALLHRPSP